MKAMKNAKGKGFTDVLYLDSVNNKYIEEASCSNIFLIKVTKYVILHALLSITVDFSSRLIMS